MDRGTRPLGVTRIWRHGVFAKACSVSDNTPSNWRNGGATPPRLDRIENAFFGPNSAADDPSYSQWREELREAHARARARNRFKGSLVEKTTEPKQPSLKGPTVQHEDRPMLLPTGVPQPFGGREQAINHISNLLGQVRNHPAIVALVGIRGVGKSTLAAAYANRHRERYRIIWSVNASTRETIQAGLTALGSRLSRATDGSDIGSQTGYEYLNRQESDTLIIFDNARHPDTVAPFLPKGGASHVLITSNVEVWQQHAETAPVGLWTAEEGGNYLLASSGRKGRETLDSAIELSIKLERLPLAHRMAAAYCQVQDVSFGEYLQIFENAPIKLLSDQKFAVMEYYGGATVAQALFVNVAEAVRKHPAASQLISYIALLGPYRIPLTLFEGAGERLEEPLRGVISGGEFRRAIGIIRQFGLLMDEEDRVGGDADVLVKAVATATARYEYVRLHGLVRRAAVSQIEGKALDGARDDLVEMLEAFTARPVMRQIAREGEDNHLLEVKCGDEWTVVHRPGPTLSDPLDREVSHVVMGILETIYETPEWKARISRGGYIARFYGAIRWGAMRNLYD